MDIRGTRGPCTVLHISRTGRSPGLGEFLSKFVYLESMFSVVFCISKRPFIFFLEGAASSANQS